MQLTPTSCCGLLEVGHIGADRDPEHTILQLLEPLRANTASWSREKAYLMFTEVLDRSGMPSAAGDRPDQYGKSLADYIENNNLGTVVRTIEPRKNWTGNTLKLYLWFPNYQTLANLDRRRIEWFRQYGAQPNKLV